MRLQLAVLWLGGRWSLLAPNARYDRYASRQSAIDAAGRLAEQARAQGHEVEILVQEFGGELAMLDDARAQRALPPEQPSA